MKWKSKIKPKENDVRYRTIFPIVPTKIGEYTYWLESVDIKEEYIGYSWSKLPEGWYKIYEWEIVGLDDRP